jgi:hypothetical protein
MRLITRTADMWSIPDQRPFHSGESYFRPRLGFHLMDLTDSGSQSMDFECSRHDSATTDETAASWKPQYLMPALPGSVVFR